MRGLQVHGESVAQALSGTRTAVNLAGVEVDDIARGQVLVAARHAAADLDAGRGALAAGRQPGRSRDGARVRVHVASAEALGRVRAARGEVARAGDDVGRPAAAGDAGRRGARRPAGAALLLAGGDDRGRARPRPAAAAAPGRPTRRGRARCATHRAGRRGRAARGRSRNAGIDRRRSLAARLALPSQALLVRAASALPDSPCSGRSRPSSCRAVRSASWAQRAVAALATFHAAQPLRPGMPAGGAARACLRARRGAGCSITCWASF